MYFVFSNASLKSIHQAPKYLVDMLLTTMFPLRLPHLVMPAPIA